MRLAMEVRKVRARFLEGSAVELRGRDLDVLEWVNEQFAVGEDQLARVFERSEWTARRWTVSMQEKRLCRRERLLRGEPAWVWLTGRGASLTRNRFRPWRGNVGQLSHVRAVVDLRLYIESQVPDARWVWERELYERRKDELDRRRGKRKRSAAESERLLHIPDAELVLRDGERHALEVELSRKSRDRLSALMAELAERYERVVYFCEPRLTQVLEDVATQKALANVAVRDLADAQPPSLDGHQMRLG